jgi:hypothetical protein
MNRLPRFAGSWEGETSKEWTRIGAMNRRIGYHEVTKSTKKTAIRGILSL